MAQSRSEESAGPLGDAKLLRDQLEIAPNPCPFAFVGHEHHNLNIFQVLKTLKLARIYTPDDRDLHTAIGETAKQKKKKDEVQLIRIEDEETGAIYELDKKPSVVISITGDAVNWIEDNLLNEGVDDLMQFCRKLVVSANKFSLSREAAHRAMLLNHNFSDDQLIQHYPSHKEAVSAIKKKALRISFLLKIRIEELSRFYDKQTDELQARVKNAAEKNNDAERDLQIRSKFSNLFKHPTIRDVLLNLTKSYDDARKEQLAINSELHFKEVPEVADLLKMLNNSKPIVDHESPASLPVSSIKQISKSR
jgi:hypothetical protein